jgi:hypothetical protein
MEHDPRFKRLLQEFFAEFLMLFFPRQAARLDFSHLEWLDKVSFADVAQGAVHVLDLVARLPRRLETLSGEDPPLDRDPGPCRGRITGGRGGFP